jgi:ribose-phosphate pyrophosphokinase
MTPATAGTAELHAFPGNEALAGAIADALGTVVVPVEVSRFPDGEARVRVGGDRSRRPAVVVCSLEHADEKILPLLFAAGALRALGAPPVGLVAPYLAYMRQDRAFHEGEAVSVMHFARVLSESVDWLVTVEPHLHRIASLDAIYSIPACAVHVSDAIATWISANVANAVVIGPDAESRQWARSVAETAGVPFEILEKRRLSSDRVEVTVPHIDRWRDRTPVVVDDMVSTGHTMLETVRHLRDAGAPAPVCVAVHALFAGDSYPAVLRAGAKRVVTTNTIAHESNTIDVSDRVAAAVAALTDCR